MLRICVDTSYLISFADPERPNHSSAVDYFRYCVASGYLLCLSTLVVSEFEVGRPASDSHLQHFTLFPSITAMRSIQRITIR
jgi:predicted nucleic acid-binding protein